MLYHFCLQGRATDQAGITLELEQERRDVGLINRNVTANGRRTSLRLEPEMWEALEEIAAREHVRVSDLISRIDYEVREGAFQGAGLTARVRVFVLGYYRSAATEAGHVNAGHGLLYRRSNGARP